MSPHQKKKKCHHIKDGTFYFVKQHISKNLFIISLESHEAAAVQGPVFLRAATVETVTY